MTNTIFANLAYSQSKLPDELYDKKMQESAKYLKENDLESSLKIRNELSKTYTLNGPKIVSFFYDAITDSSDSFTKDALLLNVKYSGQTANEIIYSMVEDSTTRINLLEMSKNSVFKQIEDSMLTYARNNLNWSLISKIYVLNGKDQNSRYYAELLQKKISKKKYELIDKENLDYFLSIINLYGFPSDQNCGTHWGFIQAPIKHFTSLLATVNFKNMEDVKFYDNKYCFFFDQFHEAAKNRKIDTGFYKIMYKSALMILTDMKQDSKKTDFERKYALDNK